MLRGVRGDASVWSRVWNFPLQTGRHLLAAALLGPLLGPGLLLLVRGAAAAVERGLGAGEIADRGTLLALFGPAIPSYLLILPLLPFALSKPRRPRGLRLGPALVALVVLAAGFDLVFYSLRG